MSFNAANSIREETAEASPGANSQRWIRTAARTKTLANNNHETVNKGNAKRKDRMSVGDAGGGRGTLTSFMNSLIVSFSLVSMTAGGAGARAIWVIALALIALAAVDRMKPSTPQRPAVVRVDNKPTRLYQEPDRQQRRRALANLSGGAVILGAIIACILGFFFTILLEVVSGLLRA